MRHDDRRNHGADTGRIVAVLVDSNVLIDVLSQHSVWYPWSSAALQAASEAGEVAINSVIYAEISVPFASIEEVAAALPLDFHYLDLPPDAAFLAGKCFRLYRQRGGQKRSPLPDFFIGAHAAVMGMTLLTRDGARYRRYFPRLTLIAPD